MLLKWQFECTKQYPSVSCKTLEKTNKRIDKRLFAQQPCENDTFPISLDRHPTNHLEMVVHWKIDLGNGKTVTRCEWVHNMYPLLMPDFSLPSLNFKLPILDPELRLPLDSTAINAIRHKMIRQFRTVKFWDTPPFWKWSLDDLLKKVFYTDVSFGVDRIAPFFFHLYEGLHVNEDREIHEYILQDISDATERLDTCRFYIFDLMCHLQRQGEFTAPLCAAFMTTTSPRPLFNLVPQTTDPILLSPFVKAAFETLPPSELGQFIAQSPNCRSYFIEIEKREKMLDWLGSVTTGSRLERFKIIDEFNAFFKHSDGLTTDRVELYCMMANVTRDEWRTKINVPLFKKFFPSSPLPSEFSHPDIHPIVLPPLVNTAFTTATDAKVTEFMNQATCCHKFWPDNFPSRSDLLTRLGTSAQLDRFKIIDEFILFFGLPAHFVETMHTVAKREGVFPIGLVCPFKGNEPITQSVSFYPYMEVLPAIATAPFSHAVKNMNANARKFAQVMKSFRIIDDGLIFLLTWQDRVELFCAMANITPVPATCGEFLAKINDNNLVLFMDLFTACTYGQTTEVFVDDPLYIPGWDSNEPTSDAKSNIPTPYNEIFCRASALTLGEFLHRPGPATHKEAETKMIKMGRMWTGHRFFKFFKATRELVSKLQELEAKFHVQAHHMLISNILTYEEKLATTSIEDWPLYRKMLDRARNYFIFSCQESDATSPHDHWLWCKNGNVERWHVSKSLRFFNVMCEYEL